MWYNGDDGDDAAADDDGGDDDDDAEDADDDHENCIFIHSLPNSSHLVVGELGRDSDERLCDASSLYLSIVILYSDVMSYKLSCE